MDDARRLAGKTIAVLELPDPRDMKPEMRLEELKAAVATKVVVA